MVQKNSQQSPKPTANNRPEKDQRELQKIEQDYVSRQFRISGLSHLMFFFMAMGIFMTATGGAGVIWANNSDLVPNLALGPDAKKHASELEVSVLNILKNLGLAKIAITEEKIAEAVKTEAHKLIVSFGATTDETAERIAKEMMGGIAFLLLVSGFIAAVFCGLCWRWFERRRIIHAIDSHPRGIVQ